MPLLPQMPAAQRAALLAEVIERAPPMNYENDRKTAEHLKWFGRAEALLDACGAMLQLTDFRAAVRNLWTFHHDEHAVMAPLHTALATAELELPTADQGAYIPPGDKWNGYAAIVKLLAQRTGELLVVDPYLDGSFLLDFMPLAHELSSIRCLTSGRYKSSLEAASERWSKDRQPAQPLQTRTVDQKLLHDRLLLFNKSEVFLVSQSFKDIGAKSPASVQRASPAIAESKVDFYEDIWKTGEVAICTAA